MQSTVHILKTSVVCAINESVSEFELVFHVHRNKQSWSRSFRAHSIPIIHSV